jgi:hypothetical protein
MRTQQKTQEENTAVQQQLHAVFEGFGKTKIDNANLRPVPRLKRRKWLCITIHLLTLCGPGNIKLQTVRPQATSAVRMFDKAWITKERSNRH